MVPVEHGNAILPAIAGCVGSRNIESLDTLFLMRMVERLLGLLSGALCVVLGYRLFIMLPEKTDSSGKLVLPGGVSIWLSRVGPGIFFALFGAAIVAYSFASTVRVTDPATLRPFQCSGDGASDTRPREGLRPNRPLTDAGMRIEPPPSEA